MKARLILYTVATFIIGYSVGFLYAEDIYRLIAPGQWQELRLTVLLDIGLLSKQTGFATGCLLASLTLGVLLSRA